MHLLFMHQQHIMFSVVSPFLSSSLDPGAEMVGLKEIKSLTQIYTVYLFLASHLHRQVAKTSASGMFFFFKQRFNVGFVYNINSNFF